MNQSGLDSLICTPVEGEGERENVESSKIQYAARTFVTLTRGFRVALSALMRKYVGDKPGLNIAALVSALLLRDVSREYQRHPAVISRGANSCYSSISRGRSLFTCWSLIRLQQVAPAAPVFIQLHYKSSNLTPIDARRNASPNRLM